MNNDLRKRKDRLSIKLGQLHRDITKENLPLIIIFQGRYSNKEKKLINSLLSIFEYKETSLYTDKEIYSGNKLLNAKMLWDSIPCKGKTTIFYTEKYFHILDNTENLYLQSFEKSLMNEEYIIIKFIFIENGNKSWHKDIELKKRINNEGVSNWNEIDLDIDEKYIYFYEKLIKELTKSINNLKDQKKKGKTSPRNYEDYSNREEINKTRLGANNNYNSEFSKDIQENSLEIYKTKEDYKDISKSIYSDIMKELQLQLANLQTKLLNEKKSLIILYEGWDAAGKGGNIKRVVKRLDPTRYKVVPISAPSEEERKYHYMRRFWRHIPLAGEITIFDRSWYGRVLVEKVERLTELWEIELAYNEINLLEEFLTRNRCIIIKIFINISKEEQLKRFNKRINNPFKSYKITNEDWRNRANWDKYEEAISKCIDRTSKDYSSWIIIDGNSKYSARIKCLEYICGVLKENL
ncbi:MAG: hypothetical protein ACLSV2_15705 [Clostridium sp.]